MYTDPRVTELLAWVAEHDRPLPLPVAVILEFEDAGCIIDLDAGNIYGSERAWLDHLAAMDAEVAL